MAPEERTIFEYIDQQNRLWKKGFYDYLDHSILSSRFYLSQYFIDREFDHPVDVLEIGAGSGHILSLIAPKVRTYVYNDVSPEALNLFKRNYGALIETAKVEILFGNIDEFALTRKYDVILVLGVLRYNFSQDLFQKLFAHDLNPGGLLIMESSVGCYIRAYYCGQLPPPTYTIEFKCEDYVPSTMPKNRLIDLFKYQGEGI
jgi:SAM-dependent methyltransferase